MHVTLRHVASIISLLSAAAGCSVTGDGSLDSELNRGKLAEPIISDTSEALIAKEPLDIEIVQAFVAEESLEVKAHLRAKTELKASEVSVTLLGLREGKVVESNSKLLSEVISSETIAAGQTLAVKLEIPAVELTEYQVKCNWGVEEEESDKVSLSGNESAVLVASYVEAIPLALENPELLETKLDCDYPPCDVRYSVKFDVVNVSDSLRDNVTFAVSLYWEESGNAPTLLESGAAQERYEQIVKLSDINLSAGEKQPMVVEIDRNVPEVPGGRFLPYVRILQ